MLAVFPYSTKDQDQAVRLAEWIRELGQNKSHHVLIVRDRRCDLEHDKAILAALEQTFAAVETLTVMDDAYDSWPESANTMFRNAAKHVEFTSKEPFLWLEPDVAPLKEGWLDAIAAAYVEAVAAGKHFMGDRVEVENVPLHMSGVACYPGIMSNHAGLAYLAQDIAWDCAAAAQIVPQAHWTNLIEHSWKRDPVTKEYSHVTFANWEQVEHEIAPETVLYHASKDGSLIRLLRERRNLPVSVLAEPNTRESTENCYRTGEGSSMADSRGGQSFSIFIKSHEPDFQFLNYCLRSIGKFATGVNPVAIVLPIGAIEAFTLSTGDHARPVLATLNTSLKIIGADEYGEDGYLSQQVFKLYADTLTDASHILFLDSDTIFTRPVTPQTYFKDGRIVWMHTPWEKTNTPWRPIVEKFMGQPVEFEFMRRHPTVVPRWLLADVRNFCLKQHNMPLDQYVMSQPHRAFSEFNVLGAFAYAFHRDKFYWVNTEEVPESEWPELTVLQKFSWGGLTEEVKDEFEAILGKEGDENDKRQISRSGMSDDSGDGSTYDDSRRAGNNKEMAGTAASGHDERAGSDGEQSGSGASDRARSESWTTVSGPAPTFQPESATVQQVPWESKEQSLKEIRGLAERLKNFCGHAAQVRTVRLELHKMGVIELPYRFRKRKGKWRRKAK